MASFLWWRKEGIASPTITQRHLPEVQVAVAALAAMVEVGVRLVPLMMSSMDLTLKSLPISVLPKPALFEQVFDLTVGARRLIGWPVKLESQHKAIPGAGAAGVALKELKDGDVDEDGARTARPERSFRPQRTAACRR